MYRGLGGAQKLIAWRDREGITGSLGIFDPAEGSAFFFAK